jgi:hypothetical protein
MKKLSLLSALLLLLGLPAMADEGESLSAGTNGVVEVPQGSSLMMPVRFVLNQEYVSYQFTINLPTGISFDEEKTIILGDGQEPASDWVPDLNTTSHIVTCYNKSKPVKPISVSEGVLVYIPIKADESVEVNAELPGSISDIIFADHNAASHADFATANYTVKIVEPGVYFDENDKVLPIFEEGVAADVHMKRTIKAGEWNTICFPFAMSAAKLTAAFGDGYDLEEFKGFDVEKTGGNVDKLVLNFAKNTKAAKINTPYLIKINSDTDITEFVVNATVTVGNPVMQLKEEDEETGEEVVVGSLIGTYTAGTIVPENSLFLSGNNFYYSAGKTKMKAFRAYFTLNEVLTDKDLASSRVLFSFDDGGTTELRDIKVLSENDGWYTLSGQKLDQKPTTKGVYIHGGEKVIIKK